MLKNKKQRLSDRETVDAHERILTANSDFNTVETYKTIRTNIMFSLPKNDSGKVIAVTSSIPNEGKTTTCINLAITFAQTGAKVILIDCDLRKARAHRYLDSDRTEGVSNILCGFADAKSAIKKNIRENLDMLSAGELPPNPAELLQTQVFSDLIEQLKQEYDYIFIDTPPVTVVTDALIISKLCMGVVIVVRENITTFDVLDETMSALKKSQTQITGVIMLGSETKSKKGEYYNSRKYKYKYNYNYGDELKSK